MWRSTKGVYMFSLLVINTFPMPIQSVGQVIARQKLEMLEQKLITQTESSFKVSKATSTKNLPISIPYSKENL